MPPVGWINVQPVQTRPCLFVCLSVSLLVQTAAGRLTITFLPVYFVKFAFAVLVSVLGGSTLFVAVSLCVCLCA